MLSRTDRVEYWFASSADANAFVAELERQAVPTIGEMVAHGTAGGSAIVADGYADVASTLERFDAHRGTTTRIVAADGYGELRAGVVDGRGELAVSREAGDDGSTTWRARGQLAVDTELGAGFQGTITGEVADRYENDRLNETTLRVSFEGQGGAAASARQLEGLRGVVGGQLDDAIATLNGPDAAVRTLQGGRSEIVVTLDHENGVIPESTSRALRQVVSGERTLEQVWPEIAPRAEVRVQRFDSTVDSGRVDFEVVEGELERRSERARSTWIWRNGAVVEPPGPRPVRVPAPGG